MFSLALWWFVGDAEGDGDFLVSLLRPRDSREQFPTSASKLPRPASRSLRGVSTPAFGHAMGLHRSSKYACSLQLESTPPNLLAIVVVSCTHTMRIKLLSKSKDGQPSSSARPPLHSFGLLRRALICGRGGAERSATRCISKPGVVRCLRCPRGRLWMTSELP